MLIAHLPAGYLLSRPLAARSPEPRRLIVTATLAGAIFPDVDLLRCYFLDGGRVPHHAYWTHLPIAWLGIAFAILGATTIARAARGGRIAAAFFAGVLSHLVLDSVAAGIEWLYPFDDRFYGLVHVPAAYGFWPLSFVLHWTFLLEIAITAAAAIVWIRARRRSTRAAIAPAPVVIEPARRYSDLLVIRGDGRDSSPAGIRLKPGR